MKRYMLAPLVLSAAIGLAACTGGASDMEYTQGRAINSDIAAVHEEQGPSSLYPGESFSAGDREPLGVHPWQLDENH